MQDVGLMMDSTLERIRRLGDRSMELEALLFQRSCKAVWLDMRGHKRRSQYTPRRQRLEDRWERTEGFKGLATGSDEKNFIQPIIDNSNLA